MKRFLVVAVIGYLTIGLVVALRTMPQQMYVCPAPEEPHGEVTYGGLDAPPRDDCRPTETTGDRLTWMAVVTPLWLPGAVVMIPVFVLKGLSNVEENRQLENSTGG